jgi:hypothetical protein
MRECRKRTGRIEKNQVGRGRKKKKKKLEEINHTVK